LETLKRYVVTAGRDRTVRDVLGHAGADARAVTEGRVFVGRKRVTREDQPVSDGDVVEIAPPLPHAESLRIAVLAQTEDLVVVDKPSGMPTIADHAGSAHSLASVLARTLGIDDGRLHATSRLDRDVSGAVVFALTREAASRLMDARACGRYERRYVAIAAGEPEPTSGSWDQPIGRAADPRLRKVGGRDPASALTRYSSCARAPAGQAMLSIAPATGRTHQIRAHAAHAGAPLVGDRAYGGPSRLVLEDGRVLEPRRIALHALRVAVPDRAGTELAVVAPVPGELLQLWSSLGGDPRSWELAAACALPGS
jgi:RluA family pseudouridine synthase